MIQLMSCNKRVVPLAVGLVSLNGQRVHLLRRHLPARLVAALIEFGPNRQPAFRRHGYDQVYDHLAADHGPSREAHLLRRRSDTRDLRVRRRLGLTLRAFGLAAAGGRASAQPPAVIVILWDNFGCDDAENFA